MTSHTPFDPFRDLPRVSFLAYHLLHLDLSRPLHLAVAPRILAGRNLLIAAATGSGKTGAVFAPLEVIQDRGFSRNLEIQVEYAREPLLEVFEGLLPGLGEPETTEVLEEMASWRLLRRRHDAHGVYPLGHEGHQWIDRRLIYTNFATPDERWATLVTLEGEILAQLPLTLNAPLLYPGSCLLCAGGKWEVLEVLCEEAIVRVAPAPPEAHGPLGLGTLGALVDLRERPVVFLLGC